MIVVVGSANMDIVVRVGRHPGPGETVIAHDHGTHHGGKGANQAVAAARLGGDVHFVGCVGDDEAGVELRSSLAHEGVDVGHLASAGGPSGIALVTVDEDGENAIVVGRGANASLALTDGDRTLISRADVVVSQLEIPLRVVVDAAGAATGTFVLNAAPARPLPPELTEAVDVLVVNEHELTVVAGGTSVPSVRGLGIETVVVTLGARGAQVVTPWDIGYIPALEVPVMDTTGAGDAFCGALAAALDEGRDVFEAAARAVAAGGLAVTRVGARAGMPTTEDLDRAMARRP
jgi:ribokinase